MAKPTIEIGIDFEQLKQMADRAAKMLRDKLGGAVKQSMGAAGPGGTPGGLLGPGRRMTLPVPVVEPKLPANLRNRGQGGMLETLLFGERGQKDAVRGIKNSLAQIGDTLTDTLGANKIGLGNLGSKFGGFGLVGGAGIAVGGMAAAGLAGSIMYGRSQERSMFSMAPYMGAGAANRALGAGRRALFDDEETMGIANPLARSGALGGLGAVLKAQRGLGIGGELSEVLGGQAARGGRVTNRSAQRELSMAVGTAVATGLDRGRIGELLKGASQLMAGRGLGVTQNNRALYGALGMVGGAFRGSQGVQAVGALERAYTNPTTQLGRNIALRTAGLGGALGGDVFGAERRMELGFFGQQGGKQGSDRQGIDQMLTMYRQAFGFGDKEHVGTAKSGEAEVRRGAMIKEMSQNMGISQTSTEAVVAAVESGKSQKEIENLMKEGRPLQDRAYEAILNMGNFKSLEKAFQESFRELWHALGPLILQLMSLVKELLRRFTPDIASGAKDFASGAQTLSTSAGRRAALAALPDATKAWIADQNSASDTRHGLLEMARAGGQTSGRDLSTSSDASEREAADVMARLVAAEKMKPGMDQNVAEAKVFSGMDNDKLQQVAVILKAAMKPPIVHIHNAPGLQATAHKIYNDGTQGTGVAGATRK